MSKLGIGTAQFGFDYGLTNSSGKVDKNVAFEILEKSLGEGIRTIDTASTYGVSEDILGEYENRNKFNIISKFHFKTKNPKNSLKEEFDNSITRLKVNQIYGYLFHHGLQVEFIDKNKLHDEISELKENKKLKKFGVSVYRTSDFEKVVEVVKPDLIQVPLNVFDQSFLDKNIVDFCKRNNIEVHARSSFLQGLLLGDISTLNDYFKEFEELLSNYFADLKSRNIEKVAGALSFPLGCDFIDKVIVGVTSTQELDEIFKAYQNQSLLDYNKYQNSNTNLINPSLWKL